MLLDSGLPLLCYVVYDVLANSWKVKVMLQKEKKISRVVVTMSPITSIAYHSCQQYEYRQSASICDTTVDHDAITYQVPGIWESPTYPRNEVVAYVRG